MQDSNILTKKSQGHFNEKLLLMLFLLLYVLIFVIELPSFFFTNRSSLLLIQAFAYGVFCIGGIFIFRHEFISGTKEWKVFALKNALWLIGAFIAKIFLTNIASLPAYLMGYETTSNDNGVFFMVQLIGKPLSLLVIGFCGPVLEECIYRAFLIGKVRTKLPVWICVIVSSALFACLHMHELSFLEFLGILPHFVSGLLYGIAYVATGNNITVPLVLHIAGNMSNLIFYFNVQ